MPDLRVYDTYYMGIRHEVILLKVIFLSTSLHADTLRKKFHPQSENRNQNCTTCSLLVEKIKT